MMKQKLPWILTAILTGLLVIVTFFWLDALARLDGGNLSAQKDVIREACSKTDDASRAECRQELADLETMLQGFLKEANQEPAAGIVATTTLR